ncbi:hypothetical protein M472_12800 [Sphingobacterium paucimobilis HER1398]|uniref:Uncharacterized protein n=1 Tax=Sphingobacterium paucimobilis HER1398 TaxID=1346330 RepID=U2HVV5_9SPHI|nr:hypothetical protein M472_12800 [Sphingobacterium paucimobilis HER1398]
MDLVGALLTTATAGAHPITDTAGEDHTTGMAAIGGTTPITILGDTHTTDTITTTIITMVIMAVDVLLILLYALPTEIDSTREQQALAVETQDLPLVEEVPQEWSVMLTVVSTLGPPHQVVEVLPMVQYQTE